MSCYKKTLILFSAISVFFAPVFFQPGNDHNAYAADRPNATQLIEPCKLLSKSEAESILGIGLNEGQYSENAIVGQKICIYEAADKDSFVFLQISLTQNGFIAPNVLASGQNAKTLFSSIKNAFPDHEKIHDVGDDAFVATPGIHILKGNYYLTIGAGNIKSNKDKLIVAGAKAIANLDASF